MVAPATATSLKDKPAQENRKLPSRTPRVQVSDAATQQALTRQAETLDAVLTYLNGVIGSKQVSP